MVNLFTDRLLIHIGKIDEQHRKIFQTIEEFFDVSMHGQNKETIVQVFNELKDSLECHFQEEERYMIKYKYPDYEAHREKHNIFMRKFYTLESAFRCDYIPFTKLTEANDFFSEGFVTHICEVDGKLGEFLKGKNIS